MKVKKLPFTYPQITGHPSTAGLFSILNCYSQTEEWIYSNYIQLETGIRNSNIYGGGSIDTIILPAYHAEKNCPFIIHALLTRDTVKALSNNILDFLVKAIDNENYLYLVADQHYFVNSFKDKVPHDMFIYGYDLQQRELYVADFTFKGKYSFEKINIDAFCKGYEAICENDDFHYYERGGVALLHFDEKATYNLDIEFVFEQFRQFVESIDYSESFRSADNPFDIRAYGLNAYKILIEYLKNGNSYGTRKSLAVVKDHKKLMVERLLYFDEKGVLKDKNYVSCYKKMYDKSNILLMLYMKYELKEREEYIEKICSGLEELCTEEKKCIEHMIHDWKIINGGYQNGAKHK